MKAVIFASIVLLGVDLTKYRGEHLHRFGAVMADFGHGIGAWVFY